MAYFVGAYWGQRGESREVCAERMSVFLRELAKLDPALSLWFKKAGSLKKAVEPLSNTSEGLLPLLKANRRDIGNDSIIELGFNFSAWTGRGAEMRASLSATCGSCSPVVRNSVVVSFDQNSSPSIDILKGILSIIVSAFDPEDAVVFSTDQLSAYPSLPVWELPAALRYKVGVGLLIGS